MLSARRSALLAAILILLTPMVSGCTSPNLDMQGGDLAEGVRSLITPSGLEEQLRVIVQHERPSGSEGENAAIDHIVAVLRGDGIPVDIYTFHAYASDPVSATIEVIGADFEPEAITYSFSAVAERLEGRLVDVGTLDDLPDLEPGTGERLVLRGDAAGRASAAGGSRGGGSTQVAAAQTEVPDLSGAIALIEGIPGTASVDQLELMGAAGAIFINSEERLNDLIVTTTWGTPSMRNYHRLPTLPAAHVKKSDGEVLRGLMSRGTADEIVNRSPFSVPRSPFPVNRLRPGQRLGGQQARIVTHVLHHRSVADAQAVFVLVPGQMINNKLSRTLQHFGRPRLLRCQVIHMHSFGDKSRDHGRGHIGLQVFHRTGPRKIISPAGNVISR